MNTEIKPIWTEQFKITSLQVNHMGRLGLFGLLNLLQETAWMQAETQGFGLKDMEKQKLFWVVTRQTVTMQEWPKYGENIQIQTWLRPPNGAFVTREFKIQDANGKDIGASTTSWVAIDRDTKKVLSAEALLDWQAFARAETTGLVAEKIAAEKDNEKLAKFRVRNSDLDTNQHVNNTKYAQWILDAIPFELQKQLMLKTYSVNFIAETYLGDEVQVERNTKSADGLTTSSGESIFRGLRTSDEKILFTAKLVWEKLSPS